MHYFISAIGFTLFAGVSYVHFSTLEKIVDLLSPRLSFFASPGLFAIWGAFQGLLLWAALRNRLRPAMGIVFAYALVVVLSGMRVLAGVPDKVEGANWSDPHNLLTPDAKFILHNHSVIMKVISRQEFELYSLAGACYMTGASLVFAAGLCLVPIDRDNQLGTRKPRRSHVWRPS